MKLAMEVDRRVLIFGNHTENKLQEYYKDGRPKFTLEKLLGIEEENVNFGSLSSRARKPRE